MKLNLGLIAEALKPGSYRIVGDSCGPLDIQGMVPLVKDSADGQDMLILAHWEELSSLHKPPPKFVCIGGGKQAADILRAQGISGLVIQEETYLSAIRSIYELFIHYDVLEHKLLNALLANSPTRTILNCVSAFFECHLMLFDGNMRLLDYSDNYTPPADNALWREILQCQQNVFATVLRDKIKASTKHASSPRSTFFDSRCGLPSYITYTFEYSGSRFATLVLMETHKPLAEYQLWLVDAVARRIAPIITERYYSALECRNFLRKTISGYLRRGASDNLVCEENLGKLGWRKRDDYQILLISLPPGCISSHCLYTYESIFSETHANCIALRHDAFILILLNGPACALLPECLPALKSQLEMDSGVCGVSMPFNDFSQIRVHYELTLLTLQHGPHNKPVRFYTDILLHHVISELKLIFPLRTICHPAAVQIEEYDRKHGTDYLITLETYLLCNKSLNLTAGKLFVHKNTIAYRLKFIEKNFRLNIADPSERLWLLLSCMALRILSENKQAS